MKSAGSFRPCGLHGRACSLLGLALAAALMASPPAAAQSIRAVTENSSHSYLRQGQVAGPATEIVKATLRQAGLNDYSLALYPWARAYDLALSEPNVLIYLIARTPLREQRFQWVGEVMRFDFHLYKLRQRSDVMVRGLQDARRYAIAVPRDDVRHQYLQGEGFTRLVVSGEPAEGFRRLLGGQADLMPLPEKDAIELCRQAGVPFSVLERVHTLRGLSTGLYLAYSRSTPADVVARTQQAFEKLKSEGGVEKALAAAR